MADASCGPSNAFKGLARHVEQDRSHQQDRVGPGSQQPAQNFRSAPLNSGLADQFGAFQQQNAAIPQHPAAGWQPLSHPADLSSHPAQANRFFPPQPVQQQAAFAPGGSGGWVGDFQRMNFSDAQAGPVSSQPVQHPVTGQPGLVGAMRFGFASQGPIMPPTTFQPPSIGLQSMQPPFGPFQASDHLQPPNHMMDSASLGLDARAAADLDREFEDAMDEWMRQNGPEADLNEDDQINAQDDDNLTAASAEPTAQEASKEDSEPTAEQQTKLALAAQRLVSILSNNKTDKFRNSEFIELMRRIATRQLVVRDNDLVETPQPLAFVSGSATYNRTYPAANSMAASRPVRTIITSHRDSGVLIAHLGFQREPA
ncbi:hypothetical protein F4802DRAFT_199604 [Xylaria palmicola]|nr:hypothetical protein F4802DRAFT_199604 [Xylaria palmicola]